MNMNTSLRVAVVMLLGTTMQSVFAVNGSPTAPIKLASETGFTGSVNVGGFSFGIPVIANREIKADTQNPPSSQPYYVVVTLTGGAKFNTVSSLSLTCGYTAVASIAAITDAPAAAAGGNVAGFRLSSGSMTGTCSLSFPDLTLSSGMKDYGIKVEARHFDTYNPVSATESGTLITFTQGMQFNLEQGKVTVDVSTPSVSRKFLAAGSVTALNSNTVVARLGNFTYTPVSEVYTTAMDIPNGGTYLSTFTLTLSGSPLAAVQETAAVGAVTAGVYLSTDGCENSAGDPGKLKYASGTQISFDIPASYLNNDTASVCMIGNDVSVIDRGTISFSVSSIKGNGTDDVPNLSIVDTTLVKVEKNGTSLKVLNIPSPDAGLDNAALRFYNMGTTPGRITGTLYGQGDAQNVGGGERLGPPSVTLIDSLAPNAVKVMNSKDIAGLFGQTKWTGRAWLQIESEIKGLRVQALIRTVVGGQQVLTNMSDRVMLDGEKIERTE